MESLGGDGDPSERIPHDSATAFLHRVSEAPAITPLILAYADEHGVDDVAELWADAPALSLAGAMWRIYLLRHIVASDVELAGYRFRRGLEDAPDSDHAIAGAPTSPTPDEVLAVADEIFTGAFTGDFASALERAAAFCRIQSRGATALNDPSISESFSGMGVELLDAARSWRAGNLH